MNAIFRKELRDVLRWSPIGMLLLAALFWHASPRQLHDVQGIERNYVSTVGIGCAVIAIALGLLQTMFDARTDARGYLLHRPIATAGIFWGKLLAGFVGYLACLLPPLILTAIYLQSKGIEQLPTAWQQLAPLMIATLIIFALHPAAMWMAHRSARWIGTRWLPLVLAIAGVMTACLIIQESDTIAFCLGIAMLVLLYVLLTCAARHAFIHQSSLPPASSRESMSWSRAIGLLLASVILVTTVLVVAVFQMPGRQSVEPVTRYRLTFSADGQPWEVGETFENARYDSKASKREGRKLDSGDGEKSKFEPLPDSWREIPSTEFRNWSRNSIWSRPFAYVAQINTSDTNYDYLSLYEHDGLLLAYKQGRGLMAIVTPQGIFAPDEVPEGRFREVQGLIHTLLTEKNLWINLAGVPLLIDSAGIYQVDFESQEIHRLVDRPTQKATITLPTDTREGMVYAVHDDQLASYAIRSHDSDELTSSDDKVVAKTNVYLLPRVDLVPRGEWKIDAKAADELSRVTQADNGVMALVSGNFRRTPSYQIFSADGTLLQKAEFTPTRHSRTSRAFQIREALEILVVPPLGVFAVLGITYLINAPMDLSTLPLLMIGLVIIAAVASIPAFWLCKWRGLSQRARIAWVVIAALTGVSALLAIVAIYPRAVRESCPSCNALRRVDQDRCEGCGADWEPPQQEGIEIFADPSSKPAELVSGSLS